MTPRNRTSSRIVPAPEVNQVAGTDNNTPPVGKDKNYVVPPTCPVFKCGRLSGLDFVCNLMNVRGDVIRSFEGVNWRKAMTWELLDAESELQAVRVQCTLIERQIREQRERRGQ